MTLSTSAVAVCCCRRFAKLVEEPRILDGDDGLRGEVLDQLDLLVGERAYLLPVDENGADHLVILQHRHHEKGPSAGCFKDGDGTRSAREIPLIRQNVGDMDHLPRRDETRKGG